jgi:CRP/FNR family transcriptional regulator, cyclic AMP receptor protein
MAFVLAKADEVVPGGMKVVDVEGQALVLVNLDGKFFGFVDRCSHLGCPLSTGTIEGSVVTCICHYSQFDVISGSVVQGPAKQPIDSYPLTVVKGNLELAIGEEAEEAVEPAKEEPIPVETVRAPRPSTRKPAEGVLARVPLFSGLDPAALESLEAFTFRRTFEPGDLIVEEGRTGNGLYVVVSGTVEVVKGLAGERPQVLATFGPGEPFGEMALLGQWPRTASVRALEDTECLGMDRWVFIAYLNREPQLAIRMLQVLAQRLADTAAKLVE